MRTKSASPVSEGIAKTKPIASLSVDLDNQWSYMKTHGDPGWESYPTYLDTVVPRILTLLDELDLKITFFVVGRDASQRKNREAIALIAAAGHEIGNHSFNHNPWLQLYSEQDLEYELQLAEEAIAGVTSQHPIGFRGPGYSFSESILKVLARRGYLYDASTLPTFLGPLARAYYFSQSDLNDASKKQRAALFGSFSDGFRPLRPYKWLADHESAEEGLIEIPVTTLPILKIPFHVSYILYLATFSGRLATTYFRIALTACRLASVQPSLLLHPLDFLGHDDLKELSFFPGMNLQGAAKLETVREMITWYSHRFQVVTLRQHASELLNESTARYAEPSISGS